MGRRTRVAQFCALVAFGGMAWLALGCASIIGADDYKVAAGDAGNVTGNDTGGACIADGLDCTASPDGCCSGVCTHPTANPMARSFCAAMCMVNTDCVSGCCAGLTNDPRHACAARGFCSDTCSFDGDACDSTDDCCSNETCVDNNVTVVCRENCMTNADCQTNCCAQLQMSSIKVCAPPAVCAPER